ncbi:hypothetical protein FHW96_000710 [Novosphingobium sp. SG751A]|uniref:DUF4304 domain-containing protein n=1 Tax=Novosphingobium sp. SG751A TaxID=2587000 RepID=UPI001554CB78|nr:DUF4304 domain-containing protein [Novosphingobium sp. SG751A]NOW44568.1 hypothetical protein [Novosphingobium sp. SG751A]
MANELAKAITKIICPILLTEGFRRARRHVFIRAENSIVQRLDFQLNGWGGRDFCVNISANLVAANEFVALQPGFRLKYDSNGGGNWLPSNTKEKAENSLDSVLKAIRVEALPYFEKIRSIEGFAALLANEQWGAAHHLSFQRGVAAATGGDTPNALLHLSNAIRLYQEDGREWCDHYVARAKILIEGLQEGSERNILAQWEEVNRPAHGIG